MVKSSVLCDHYQLTRYRRLHLILWLIKRLIQLRPVPGINPFQHYRREPLIYQGLLLPVFTTDSNFSYWIPSLLLVFTLIMVTQLLLDFTLTIGHPLTIGFDLYYWKSTPTIKNLQLLLDSLKYDSMAKKRMNAEDVQPIN